jgi:hypothetical protein
MENPAEEPVAIVEAEAVEAETVAADIVAADIVEADPVEADSPSDVEVVAEAVEGKQLLFLL